MLNYKVISSGSHGNAVLIENILIDIGVSYKMIEPYMKEVKYLLITHKHVDHLKLSTFKMIKKKWGHVKVITNYEVAQEVGIENVYEIVSDQGFIYDYDDMLLRPFKAWHDVVCTGYVIFKNDLNIIYTTDNYNMCNAPTDIKYDYLFIESNHDEKKIEMYKNSREFGYDVYYNAKRHLSTQQCKTFYYGNRRNKDSELIELHKSKRFY